MTAAGAFAQPGEQPGKGKKRTEKKVPDDQQQKIKRNYVRKNKPEEKNVTPVVAINEDVARKIADAKLKQKKIEELLFFMKAPAVKALPAPAIIVPKELKTSAVKPAPCVYNNGDMLYLLSRLVVGNQIIHDVSNERRKVKPTIGGLVQAYVFRYNSSLRPAEYKTYYKNEIIGMYQNQIVDSLIKNPPTLGSDKGPDIEEPVDLMAWKGMEANQTADVLNKALIFHKDKDPLFKKLPSNVYIDESDLQNLLQQAATRGVSADPNEDAKTRLDISDPYKTGKFSHGVEQGKRYVDDVVQEVAQYWYELCAPYMTDEYKKTAWVFVPQ